MTIKTCRRSSGYFGKQLKKSIYKKSIKIFIKTIRNSCELDYEPSVTSSSGLVDEPSVTSSSELVDEPGVTSSSGLDYEPGVTSSSGLVDEPGVTSSSGLVDEPGVTSSILASFAGWIFVSSCFTFFSFNFPNSTCNSLKYAFSAS